MKTTLSLLFLAARLGDWLTTLSLGGESIEANPIALMIGLFPTMAITSLIGLAAVIFAWKLEPRAGKLGMAALLVIAFAVLIHNAILLFSL